MPLVGSVASGGGRVGGLAPPGMKVIAAIDGGGTKTDCLLASLQGQCLGHGQGGPSVPLYVPWEQAVAAVRTAFCAAQEMAPRPLEIVAIAGALPCGAEVVRAVAGDNGFPVEAVWPVSEAVACLAVSGESHGLVIMAGTGSFAAAVRDGQHVTYAGGKGPLLGDEGSAYAIAVAALRAVARAMDRRGPETQLTELIRAHLGVESAWGLVGKVYDPPLARHEIAGIAPLVSCAADRGDQTARAILTSAAHDLADMAQAALCRAGWSDGELPAVFAGGALLGSHGLQQALRAALKVRAPRARPLPLPLRPVFGVAVEGIARATGERTPATLDRLRETAPAEWRV